jgi:osmotically-inducible protein OsmY
MEGEGRGQRSEMDYGSWQGSDMDDDYYRGDERRSSQESQRMGYGSSRGFENEGGYREPYDEQEQSDFRYSMRPSRGWQSGSQFEGSSQMNRPSGRGGSFGTSQDYETSRGQQYQGSYGYPQSQGSYGYQQGQGSYGYPQSQGSYGYQQGQGAFGSSQGREDFGRSQSRPYSQGWQNQDTGYQSGQGRYQGGSYQSGMGSWQGQDYQRGFESQGRMGSQEEGRESSMGMRQGKGPRGYKRSDERIREDICDRLSQGSLDASDIEVEVKDGEVTLSGSIQDRREKHLVENIADSVPGVKDVQNQIRVKKQSFEHTPEFGREKQEDGGLEASSETGKEKKKEENKPAAQARIQH